MKIIAGALAIILASAIVNGVAAQDRVARISVIEDLTGPDSRRGALANSIYRRALSQITAAGGIRSNSDVRRIDLIVKDSSSNPALTATLVAQAIAQDRPDIVMCSRQACLQAAVGANIPVIFTGGGFRITSDRSRNVFAINAPGFDDTEPQAELAIRTAIEAVRDARELTTDSLITAIKNLAFTSDFGSVRFDDLGNNIGQIAYRIGPTSRPDAAGCSRSCASSCPTACGTNKCTKEGSNECCDICGMPPQPGWRRVR